MLEVDRVIPFLLIVGIAAARPPAATVQAELDDPAGWTFHREKDGVKVYGKPIPSMARQGWMGVLKLPADLDPTRLFTVICDIENHENLSDSLEDSKVVRRVNGVVEYFQVMKPPALVPVSPRYWVSRSREQANLDGEAGHYKRAWDSAGPGELADIRAEVNERFPKAIEVVTSGSWELDPQSDGSVDLVYRTVADPGGNLPESLADNLSGRTLPDNIHRFVKAARR